MEKISNKQRAFWMVLITSLAAPFLAGLIGLALAVVANAAGLQFGSSPTLSLGESAMTMFAWSAIPATIAALGLTPYVLQNGTYSWMHAAVAGVLAFGVSTIIAPITAGAFMSVLAFTAGVIALAMRSILIRGKILLP